MKLTYDRRYNNELLVREFKGEKGKLIMITTKKATATVKKATAAKEIKPEETKVVEAKEVKETPVKKEVEVKAAPVKKEAEVKAPAKKVAAKKTTTTNKTTATAKKAPAKKATKTEDKIAVQFADKNYTSEDLVKIANDVWVYDYGKDVADLKDVQLYVKPEESKVYYVFNNEVAGDFNI